jgi:hypothetical protein
VVAGGDFVTAGGQGASHIARWDGSRWLPLGAGLNTYPSTLVVHGASLVAGGEFTSAGGQPASHVARWDGASWTPIGAGLSYGVNAAAVFGGDLVVATSCAGGGFPFGCVKRWDGATWATMGSEMNEGIFALEVYEGALIAGGAFTTSGGVGTHGVARWDGSAWSPMGGLGGFENWVADFVVLDGALCAGGWFGFPAVARWNGMAWVFLGPGPSGAFLVNQLAAYRGQLIAGLHMLLPMPSTTLVWTGESWAPLGAGTDHTVYAMLTHNGQLVAGGSFATAGGLPSPYWARWGCPCYTDCNNSSTLTVADFGCFQTQFVLGHPYADCNADGTLTVADFGCFQTKFVQGCP